MPGNTFGQLFRLTTFGESHGEAIGGVIDGCPPGLELDTDFIQKELDRRRPGQSKLVSQRKESDTLRFISGVFEGKTTGAPLAFLIPNEDQRPADYDHNRDVFRPSHADYTYHLKYGLRDHRGGGRSSARETATRVAAGAVAKLLLRRLNVQIYAYVSRVGALDLGKNYLAVDPEAIETNVVRCPDPELAEAMIASIEEARKQGDTLGGTVTCVVRGCPPGLGEPVFDKLHADLGKAMLSINAVKGFEMGSGFEGTRLRGSQHNDIPVPAEEGIRHLSNHSGGVQGGISNGEAIYFTTAFKPVATLMQEQLTVNDKGEATRISGRGRHDPCVVPRAVPIVEAMTALVLADHFLRQQTLTSLI